jgi:hypothetical protein
MNYFEVAYENIARPMASFRMWAIIVANLLQALLISIIYSKYFNKGGSPMGQGFACGFWLGLYSSVPYIFYMYAGMQIHDWKALVVDGLIIGFMTVVAAIGIALVYGKTKEQTAAA